MIAPCSPAPEIAGKLSPRKPSTCSRNASSAIGGGHLRLQARRRRIRTASAGSGRPRRRRGRGHCGRRPARPRSCTLSAAGTGPGRRRRSRRRRRGAAQTRPAIRAASTRTRFPASRSKAGRQRIAGSETETALPSQCARFSRQLCRVDEQFRGAIGMDDREAQGKRGERHVARRGYSAATRSTRDRSAPRRPASPPSARAATSDRLSSDRPARIGQWVRNGRRCGRRGPIGPHCIDRIVCRPGPWSGRRRCSAPGPRR